jgi:hypothetical protein
MGPGARIHRPKDPDRQRARSQCKDFFSRCGVVNVARMRDYHNDTCMLKLQLNLGGWTEALDRRFRQAPTRRLSIVEHGFEYQAVHHPITTSSSATPPRPRPGCSDLAQPPSGLTVASKKLVLEDVLIIANLSSWASLGSHGIVPVPLF